MKNTTLKYKVIDGSLLLCKMKLLPLVRVSSFLKNGNQIAGMIMDLYKR
jgi:hypothetical protein